MKSKSMLPMIAGAALLLLISFLVFVVVWANRGTAGKRDPRALVYENYEPSSINPINYKEAGATEILEKWLFESLLENDPETGEHRPMLAKSWQISEDGKQFTFNLDERAKWFDGSPVTAEDVKFSFEVFSMPGAKAPFRKSKMRDFVAIDVLAPGTIRFTGKERLFSNFEFLAGTIILPKHLYYYQDPQKLEKNEHIKNPKGSGPYLLETWEKGRYSLLKRNPNWWGRVLPWNKDAFGFDRIMIKYVRDPQIAFEMFKKGELDYLPVRIGNTQIWKQTQSDAAFQKGNLRAVAVSNRIQQGYGFIGFNLRNELFQDVRVRRALSMAVNREELIKKSLGGLAVIPRGPLYSVNNDVGNVPPVAFDLTAAAAELAAAGWKDSDGDYILEKNGRKLSFTVLVPNARIEKELLFVQSYWRKIGVEAKIKILEYSTWQQLQNERKFEAIANGKNRTFYERNVDPYGEWHSSNVGSGLSNHLGYVNPKADRLMEEGRMEMDAKKRKALFTQVNDMIAQDLVMFQYSESKYSMFVINSRIDVRMFEGNPWLPYSFGEKYWRPKLD
jgi:ABC-type transport system substrate-binding protein